MMGAAPMGSARCEMFADWTDRIAAGEVPPAPPRPQGIERNVVITMWDWADPKAYLHDLVSTDRRNPTVNANGPVYGVLEASADYLPVLDPRTHTASRVPVTVRDPEHAARGAPAGRGPSPYWGTRRSGPAGPTCTTRCSTRRGASGSPPGAAAGQPGLLQGGVDHPSARLFPLNARAATWRCTTRRPGDQARQHLLRHAPPDVRRGRQQHPLDERRRTGGGVAEHRLWDETGDEERAQGWTALIMDTNGNGRRDEYVEPNARWIPPKDKRFPAVRRRLLRRWRRRPTGRSGERARLPRRGHPAEPRATTRRTPRWPRSTSAVEQPTADPGRGLLAARDGRRPERRVLGRAGERPHGQLRPPQVHAAR
jgi:hypothetical protein